MNFELKNKLGHQFFLLKDDDGIAFGEIFFHVRGRILTIEHTEVEKAATGKGAGKALVRKAVEYAREQNLEVVVLCPFAKSVIEKTPEFQDVLSKSFKRK